MKNINKVLGIDVGGTSIKSSIVDIDNGSVLDEIYVVKTPLVASIEPISIIFSQIKQKFNWKGPIGCGFPGVIKNGKILSAANLSKKWIGINLNDLLKSIYKNDVSTINDADAAGIAEINFGAGKNWHTRNLGVVLILTFGTGIGCSLFTKGLIVPNLEFGHIKLEGIEAEKYAATVVMEKENLNWQEWGKRVDQYLQIMYSHFSPNLIIIGGGVSASHRKYFQYFNVDAEVLPAKLRNTAGIIGAALALEQSSLP